MKIPRRNNLHLITQTNIWHLTPPHPRRPPSPLRIRLANGRTIRQAMHISRSIHAPRCVQARAAKSFPGIMRFSDDGRVLVEDGIVVRICSGEFVGDALIIRSGDGVLGDIFDLVGLGVGSGTSESWL
jgi:hypothetical protein